MHLMSRVALAHALAHACAGICQVQVQSRKLSPAQIQKLLLFSGV